MKVQCRLEGINMEEMASAVGNESKHGWLSWQKANRVAMILKQTKQRKHKEAKKLPRGLAEVSTPQG